MRKTVCLCLFLLVVAGACSAPEKEFTTAAIQFDGKDYRVSGPYAHENLAVFAIHTDGAADREFITLDEGLENGWVEVTEKTQEQVSELVIENRSGRPLFLHEGDRLKGGKQDRIVGLSMIIPPKSGQQPLPAFCVESGRWTRGAHGKQFVQTDNAALASNWIRFASKVQRNQGQVWANVAQQKGALQEAADSPNTNSSLNEALDSRQVQDLSARYEEALLSVLESQAGVVGVAFVVNGEIWEISVYPSASLAKKLYPRLLKAYAIQASTARSEESADAFVGSAEVVSFMQQGEKTSEKEEKVNEDNDLRTVMFEAKVNCRTLYAGQPVHTQWLLVPEQTESDVPQEFHQRQQLDFNNNEPQRQNEIQQQDR